jgi:ATP-dependent helicase HrpB
MPDFPPLPILEALPGVLDALASGRRVVLEAPPGAGKSTIVPLVLLDAPWRLDRRVVMLEPRRIAARAIAERMAGLLGERPGGRVGFRTRLETRVGPRTRIEIVTEGILTRMLQKDPALEDVSCVIFDEFHERNLHADLGLALALESQRHLRPDLRLLLMSATPDHDALARALGEAKLVSSLGRSYGVQIVHAPPSTDAAPLATSVAGRILQCVDAHDGDVLAFLPGAGEIRRVLAAIESQLPSEGFALLPLYGELPARQQDAALGPDPRGRRKVVLATNIAETSLTIDGIRIVVDGGLERRNRFDPSTAMNRLETTRISQASAEQRSGRAGRTAPGVCYRLWSESLHASLAQQAPAEILETDLAPLALELACWGTTDADALGWIDPPPPAALSQARELLRGLEAIDASGRVTPLGREMASLGVHPRLAHMVLQGRRLGIGRLACELAALLTERDPLRGPPFIREPDVRHRLDAMHGAPPPHGFTVERSAMSRIERIATQLERRTMAAAPSVQDSAPIPQLANAPDSVAGLLLAFAYPDRIGRRRGESGARYLLSGGRGAVLPGPSALARSGWIAVAALDAGDREARIELAAPIDRDLLESHLGHLIREETRVEWDERAAAVAALRRRRLGAVTLTEEPLSDPGAPALEAMLQGIRSLGLGCLPWTRDLGQWRARVQFARSEDPDGPWPDVSDAALLGSLGTWLAPWLDGVTRADRLSRVDLRSALESLLDWPARSRLERFAPTHFTVPSGSRIAIDYASGLPVLAVRLQEVFGLTESPRVAEGRAPLTLELLSPARRPVQVTRDLTSFWARGYHEVRKELKGRYPKHYWPENPHEATPTRRVRPPGA